MTTPTTWDALIEGLSDVLGRLSGGTVLQLQEAAHPDSGWYAQLWQDPDALRAEIPGNDLVDPGRRLPAGRAHRIGEIGWNPPGEDHPWHWWLHLEWPASASDYQELAVRLVAVLRDVVGLRSPADLTYRAWRAGPERVEKLLLPELGLDWLDIRYFARLAAGDTRERPAGLLRRTRIGARVLDEALGRDARWHPTETLERAELGELVDDLAPIDVDSAQRVEDARRQQAENANL